MRNFYLDLLRERFSCIEPITKIVVRNPKPKAPKRKFCQIGNSCSKLSFMPCDNSTCMKISCTFHSSLLCIDCANDKNIDKLTISKKKHMSMIIKKPAAGTGYLIHSSLNLTCRQFTDRILPRDGQGRETGTKWVPVLRRIFENRSPSLRSRDTFSKIRPRPSGPLEI